MVAADNNLPSSSASVDSLFERVATILDQARGAVVRSVNNHMVRAYWNIGREIVETMQGGEERAQYGRGLLDNLASRLTERYGRGFSTTNLRYFRAFHQVYAERTPEIRHMACGEFDSGSIRHMPCGALRDVALAVEGHVAERGFSPGGVT